MAMIFKEWDVDNLLRKIPAYIMFEWQEFFSYEPQGCLAEDRRTAQISALLATINSSKQYPVKDFLANYHLPDQALSMKPQTPEQMMSILDGMISSEHTAQ